MPGSPSAALRSGAVRLQGRPGVCLVIAALLAGLSALAPDLLAAPPLGPGPDLPWWALALMFAAVEVCVLHVQVRREAQTVSLHEIPLVLGLFLAAPGVVLLARLVGPLPVLLLHRRQSPLKAGYNAVLFLTDAAVALAVFRLFPVTSVTTTGWAWLAGAAAVVAAGTVAATATTLVIAVHEGCVRREDLWRVPLLDAPRAVAVGVLGLIAVYALSTSVVATVPLLAAAGIVLVAYRAYASLSERHLSLERLYRFSQAVSSSPEMEGVLRSVLVEAKDLLRAESAHVVFLAPAEGSAVHVTLTSSGRLLRRGTDVLLRAGSVDTCVVASGSSELLARGTKQPAHVQLLNDLGVREAVVVPLRGEAGIVGTMTVCDRLGEVRTFDASDVRLLETVANHASVALQNGRLIDQLRHDALHDALTGLPNRVSLQRELGAAVEALEHGDARGVAVMIIDLDGFKEVNDTLGHLQGDALLREVAVRFRDAAGEDALVARLGGDEFAVLMHDVEDVDAAVLRARCLVSSLEHPITLEGLDVEVGGSLGVAFAPDHGADPTALLKRADLAMYAAKGTSAGVRLYEPDMDTGTPQRLALVGELRQAIELEQLEVHVQPKARVADGEITGVEALVRWRHPVHGLVPPDDFVPVAERAGLIGPLTQLVLRTSLQACAQWRATGRELGIAVNLSARSLTDLDLVSEVSALLRRYDVPPHLLTLELTESSVMTDPARAMGLLTALHDMGVRLSIDDFGTGYSSLSYLKRLPVDEVKIDRSFVTDLVHDNDDQTIVRSIIDLARNLSLEVVAEGVEDQAAWDRLHELGCSSAQGWHLGRPVPLHELPGWLDEHLRRAGVVVPGQRGPSALPV